MDDALQTPTMELNETLDALNSISTYSLSNQPPVPAGEKVTPPTWNMFEFFAKSLLRLIMNMGGEQSPELTKFHQYFQKFRDIAFTRFCTSSEEKGTIDSYHNKIFQREDKAIKDLAALEQQLQFEREERAKAFSRYQMAEHHLHQEEELVKEEALEVEQNLETEFNAIEEQEMKTFQTEEDHERMRSKLEVYQTYFRNKELEEARRQEQERLKNEAILAKLKRREDAVIFIQFVWRRHRHRKRAKEALEKKEKGKKAKKGTTSSKSAKKSPKGSKAKKSKPRK